MDKNIIKKQISQLTETISEQSRKITGYEHNVPQIEIDIIMSNIRELYEAFSALNKDDHYEQEKPEPAKIRTEINEVETIDMTNVFKDNSNKTEITKQKEPEPVYKKEAPVITEVQKQQEENNTVQDKKTTLDLFSTSGQPTIADKYKDSKTSSINEKIGNTKTDETIASKMQKKPISDLKAAIGINEKFLFINELFKGNMEDYNEAVSKINMSQNYEEAVRHLDSFKKTYTWNDNSNSLKIFRELIQRRFI